jgi:hypothetical protein
MAMFGHWRVAAASAAGPGLDGQETAQARLENNKACAWE